MINPCVFCNKVPPKIEHANNKYLDVYVCTSCLGPEYNTKFREIANVGESVILADSIRIDDFYIIRNFEYNPTYMKANYTRIYRDIIGCLDTSNDMEPLSFRRDPLICQLDIIIELPWYDLELCKQKLQIYTTFS